MALEHTIGVAGDITIMSLLALSAWLVLRVGRISFGQQAFFGLGAYASAMASAMAQAFGVPGPYYVFPALPVPPQQRMAAYTSAGFAPVRPGGFAPPPAYRGWA